MRGVVITKEKINVIWDDKGCVEERKGGGKPP